MSFSPSLFGHRIARNTMTQCRRPGVAPISRGGNDHDMLPAWKWVPKGRTRALTTPASCLPGRARIFLPPDRPVLSERATGPGSLPGTRTHHRLPLSGPSASFALSPASVSVGERPRLFLSALQRYLRRHLAESGATVRHPCASLFATTAEPQDRPAASARPIAG